MCTEQRTSAGRMKIALCSRGRFSPGNLSRDDEAPAGALSIREHCDLTRYRKVLIQERMREANRLQKVPEDAGIRLASVATDVVGARAEPCSRPSRMHLAFGPPALLRTPGQEGVDPLETALRCAAAFAKTARWNQPGAPLVYSTTRPAPELVARVEALGLP